VPPSRRIFVKNLDILTGGRPSQGALCHIRQPVADTNWPQVGGKPRETSSCSRPQLADRLRVRRRDCQPGELANGGLYKFRS
jgi:hypothetical protein